MNAGSQAEFASCLLGSSAPQSAWPDCFAVAKPAIGHETGKPNNITEILFA